eukprot:TRINITY_DN50860_c0_g1_i1.p1 TRINITY_DN50860_c0_g1~~TRINITY_DN50860_c0_g1_i1.p1  ORF type:complete len:941 (+),score=453.74 TRINITY_DN50860_c0_g1_i1:95-2917(+)
MPEEKKEPVAVAAPADKKEEEKGKGKGKKDKDKKEEPELSEEDQKIKDDVELCVTRIQDEDRGLGESALKQLTELLRTSTGSVTSIPKPLKFCRPHYKTLSEFWQKLPAASPLAKGLADCLALVAMTMPVEDQSTPALDFKLKGNPLDLEPWGHEFVQFIAQQIGVMWRKRHDVEEGTPVPPCDDLQALIDQIVPFDLKHNSEPAACDLLYEVDQTRKIIDMLDPHNHERICSYLLAESFYLPYPENIDAQGVAYDIYVKVKSYPQALRMAIKLNDQEKMKKLFELCEDDFVKKQMAVMLGRLRIVLDDEWHGEQSDELNALIWNAKLSEYYLYAGRDLDSMEPKSPEDIYKTHLQDQRTHLSAGISSHQLNLASSFVNGFVNAGFESDTLLTPSTEAGNDWIYKNKDHRMISAAASMGLLFLWDTDTGINKVDKFLYSDEDNIKAGALMAMGILHCGVKTEFDACMAAVKDYLHNKSRNLRVGAIIALGFAYAGSRLDTMKELLNPLVADSEQPLEVQAFAALSLALIFVGSCNEDVSEVIFMCLAEKDDEQAKKPLCRFIALAAGLVFLGSQEGADSVLEGAAVLNDSIRGLTEIILKTCAYAATGNVEKIQQLLSLVAEQSGKKRKKDDDDSLSEDEKKKAEEEAKKKEEEEANTVTPEMAAALGVALITLGEPLGCEMCKRMFDSVLQYGSGSERRAVPLALALVNVSSPVMQVIDTLSKLSHDPDSQTSQNAIIALGIVCAGTNNARVATMLRNLASFYAKEAGHLFLVRVAQGLVSMGKGHITCTPVLSDRSIVSPVALGGLLVVMFAMMDAKNTILGQHHYMLFYLVTAMNPRFLVTLIEEEGGGDDDLAEKSVSVRVGTAVDTVAMAGNPKRITGFQTHDTPVLLQYEDRAELGTDEWLPQVPVLEGIVLLRKNPDWVEEKPKGPKRAAAKK